MFASPHPGEQGDVGLVRTEAEAGEGEAVAVTRTLVPRGGADIESLNHICLSQEAGGEWGMQSERKGALSAANLRVTCVMPVHVARPLQ